MEYKVNWTPHIYLVASSSLVFILFVILNLTLDSNWIVSLLMDITFFIWLLIFCIAIAHTASYIKIENGIITHRIFGFDKAQYLLSELISYREVPSTLPCILEFKSGKILRVTGMVNGNKNKLVQFLKEFGNDVKINIDD